ncbi:38159_t:CDS:2, partial [Gigaspora margarita]
RNTTIVSKLMEEQDLNQELNIEINEVIDSYNLPTSIDYNHIIAQIDNLMETLLRLKLGYLDDKEKSSNSKVIVERKTIMPYSAVLDPVIRFLTAEDAVGILNHKKIAVYGSPLEKSTMILFDEELSHEPTDEMLIVNKTVLEQDRELVKEIVSNYT